MVFHFNCLVLLGFLTTFNLIHFNGATYHVPGYYVYLMPLNVSMYHILIAIQYYILMFYILTLYSIRYLPAFHGSISPFPYLMPLKVSNPAQT